MTRMSPWSLAPVLALCLAQSAASAESAGLTAEECRVFERERSFADSVDRHDAKAFAAHLHANAVFNAASPSPQRGRDAILAAWKDIIDGAQLKLEWRPQFVSIGTDANVAMSRGPYVLTTRENGATTFAIGTFVSVWTRTDARSPWFVMLDGGGAAPTRATADEAARHLAAAPATCPRQPADRPL